jgi:hypothetical protein
MIDFMTFMMGSNGCFLLLAIGSGSNVALEGPLQPIAVSHERLLPADAV